MRRIFLLALLLSLAGGLRSQVVIGTNLNYSHSGYTFTKGGLPSYDSQLPQGWDMECAVRVGHSFQGDFFLGFDLGYGRSNYTHTTALYNPDSLAWLPSALDNRLLNNFRFALVLRKQVHDWGSLSIHAEVNVGYDYGWGTLTHTEYTTNAWGELAEVNTYRNQTVGSFFVRAVPVFSYDFGNKFSMDAYLDFASLVFSRTVTDSYLPTTSAYPATQDPDLDSHAITTDLSLGLRTLSTRLLTLGFTRTF